MANDFDIKKVGHLQFEGIDHGDYPDYCDAYVVGGDYDGRELTDEEVDLINDEYRDFMYEKLMNHIF